MRDFLMATVITQKRQIFTCTDHNHALVSPAVMRTSSRVGRAAAPPWAHGWRTFDFQAASSSSLSPVPGGGLRPIRHESTHIWIRRAAFSCRRR